MSKTKHTYCADLHRLHVSVGGHALLESGEPVANTRLIAAAPEMLEALQVLMRYAPGAYVDDRRSDKEIDEGRERAFGQGRAAIAKALGDPHGAT